MSTRRMRRWLVGLATALVVSFSIVPEITLAADGGLAQPDTAAPEKGGGVSHSACKPGGHESPMGVDGQCGWH